jgi:trimeric autotransporter adhesin
MKSLPHRFIALTGRSLNPLSRAVRLAVATSAALVLAAGFLAPVALHAASEKPAVAPYGFTIDNIFIQMPSSNSTGASYLLTTSKGGYEGTVDYSCALIGEGQSSPSPAECAMYPSSVKVLVNGSNAPQILVFGSGTKLPAGTSASLSNRPSLKMVLGAGGVAFAGCLIFTIPARRRGWRTMLSVVLLLGAMGGMSACVTPAKYITAGTYTFQVTGVDSTDSAITGSGTVTVHVLK